MSEQPLTPTVDFSRILIDVGRYIQCINLSRIIDELEEKNIFTSQMANSLRSVDDEYEKSNIVTGVLQGKNEKDFKTFLRIVASEKKGSKFYNGTKMFFSGFTKFSGYDQYATWPDVDFSSCGFTQIGNEVVLIVGREGAISYDPVHGSTLHVPEDSLPDGIDEVEVIRKHGFNACKLHPSMQICSATVYFEMKSSIQFTKDIFIEIPHSYSSIDTQDLCYIKYEHDMDSTGYGEIQSEGLFPLGYPYGVIVTRTFSSYSISTKKQWRSKAIERKTRLRNIQSSKLLKNKVKPQTNNKETTDQGIVPNAYWLSLEESDDKHTISFSLSHCIPTGYKVLQQSKKGCEQSLCKLSFLSDELVFHPQKAEDCGWRMFAANDKYMISKSEVDYHAKVTYHLNKSPSLMNSSLCIPLTITGGDNQLTHFITNVNTDATISIVNKETLHKLYTMSVKANPFLQDLAMKLPVWQPLARLLGLGEVDIKEIEVNYRVGQREDGSFPPVFKAEQPYQALLKWMQAKGHDATYGELLVALYNATLSNDHINDAWHFAYHELTKTNFSVACK